MNVDRQCAYILSTNLYQNIYTTRIPKILFDQSLKLDVTKNAANEPFM